MELQHLMRILLRRKWMILILCLSAMVGGFLLSYLIEDKYESSALILVTPRKQVQFSVAGGKEILNVPVGQTSNVETPGKTYVELITSYAVVSNVVRSLDLAAVTGGSASGDSLFKKAIKGTVQFLKYGRILDEDPFNKAVEALQKNLLVNTTADTYVFSIAYRHGDPQLTADIVNKVAQVVVQYSRRLSHALAAEVRAFMAERVAGERKHITDLDRQVQQYKESHRVFALSDEYKETLKIMTDLVIEKEKSEASLQGLYVKYPESSPQLMAIKAERDYLVRRIGELSEKATQLPALERELKDFERGLEEAKTTYEFLSKEFHEATVLASFAMPDMVVIAPAIPADKPTKPKHAVYSLISLFAALVAGVSLTFLLEYLDTSLRSVSDVERVLGLPVLATIPESGTGR